MSPLFRLALSVFVVLVCAFLWLRPEGVRIRRQHLFVHAASRGTMPVLRVLHYLGADPASPATGACPLYYAAWHGQPEAVEFLLSRGAGVDAADASGSTPLMAAASQGHDKVVSLLLAHKASVNAVSRCGNALDLALAGRHPSTAAILTAAGAVPSSGRR